MSLISQVKAYFRRDRTRNNILKLAQVGLMSIAGYTMFTMSKPPGTFGQKKMLEGEDAWANDD